MLLVDALQILTMLFFLVLPITDCRTVPGTKGAREHSDLGTRASRARARLDDSGARACDRTSAPDARWGDGGAVSTVIENLLARKQKLVELLEKAQAVEDRDKIEHQLEQINTALDFLDRPESKDAR